MKVKSRWMGPMDSMDFWGGRGGWEGRQIVSSEAGVWLHDRADWNWPGWAVLALSGPARGWPSILATSDHGRKRRRRTRQQVSIKLNSKKHHLGRDETACVLRRDDVGVGGF